MGKTLKQKIVLKANEGTIFTRITQQIIEDGKSVEIDLELTEEEVVKFERKTNLSMDNIDELFPIVDVESISLEDEFLKHKPKTDTQKVVKEAIKSAIKSGIKNFRHNAMDPTIDKDDNVFFLEECKPAIEHSAIWWEEVTKDIMPAKNSIIGNERQYYAFLGMIIKELVEEQKLNVKDAWRLVCDESQELGHFLDSTDSEPELKKTGSRNIGIWFDLANTCKIIKRNVPSLGYLRVSGSYKNSSETHSLATVEKIYFNNCILKDGVGWIVMDV